MSYSPAHSLSSTPSPQPCSGERGLTISISNCVLWSVTICCNLSDFYLLYQRVENGRAWRWRHAVELIKFQSSGSDECWVSTRQLHGIETWQGERFRLKPISQISLELFFLRLPLSPSYLCLSISPPPLCLPLFLAVFFLYLFPPHYLPAPSACLFSYCFVLSLLCLAVNAPLFFTVHSFKRFGIWGEGGTDSVP